MPNINTIALTYVTENYRIIASSIKITFEYIEKTKHFVDFMNPNWTTLIQEAQGNIQTTISNSRIIINICHIWKLLLSSKINCNNYSTMMAGEKPDYFWKWGQQHRYLQVLSGISDLHILEHKTGFEIN